MEGRIAARGRGRVEDRIAARGRGRVEDRIAVGCRVEGGGSSSR